MPALTMTHHCQQEAGLTIWSILWQSIIWGSAIEPLPGVLGFSSAGGLPPSAPFGSRGSTARSTKSAH